MWRVARKVLRWIGRIGLGVLALAIVALATALIVVHTDWGRERLRQRVERVLREMLPGGAKIGAIEGSVLGRLVIRDIEIDAMTKKPFVKVGRVEVDVAIWPLLGKTARVEAIWVDEVVLDPAAGPLMPSKPEEPAGEPSSWRVELPRVELHHASVALAGADPVHDLDVMAAATIAGSDISAYAWIGAAWGDKRVDVAAAVAIDRKGVRVPAALVTMEAGGGRARVGVQDLIVDMARPRGGLVVSAPAQVVNVWYPEASQRLGIGAPLGDVMLRAELGDDTAPGLTKITLAGRTGIAAIDATLHAALAKRTARGLVQITDLALAPLSRGSFSGTNAVVVSVDASLDHARLQLAVLPKLRAQPELATHAVLDRADKALVAHGELERLAIELAGPHAPVGPRVFATAELIRHGASWSLVASRAAGTISEAAAAGQPVRGSVAFHVQAVAPREPAPLPANAPPFIVDADVDGSIVVRSGGFGELAVERAEGEFRGRITGKDVQVRGELDVQRFSNAGQPIGNVRVAVAHRSGQPIVVEVFAKPSAAPVTAEVSARVALGEAIRVELPKLALELPDGKRWAGGGGVVTIGDRIALRGLSLGHRGATLTIAGQFDPARGDFSAKITAEHIALAALHPKLHGEGGSVISVERRSNRWRADARLDIAGFAAGKSPPTDASVHLALANDKLAIDAHATGPDTGAIDLALAADAPRDPTNVVAWRRLDARAIHTIKITAHQLALGGVAERAVSPADLAADDAPAAGDNGAATEPIRGTVDGELDLAPHHPGGSLAIRGVVLPIGLLDGDVVLAPHDGQLAIKLDARIPDVAIGHVSAELAVPQHPFDAATWRGGGLSLLRDAEASLDKVRINPALLERMGLAKKLAARGIDIPYRASVALQAHVGPAVSDARVNFDITGVRGGVLVQSLAEHLELDVDATGTRLHGELRGGGTQKGVDGDVPLGTLDATLAMSTAQWLATPKSALDATLSARWVLAESDARPILAIVGRKELTSGTLAIDAAVRGTPHAPIIDHADITARKLAVAAPIGGHTPPMFDELGVSARMADGVASATLTGREAGGGTIDAKLDAQLAVLGGATGTLTAHQVDLAPIAALLPGRFSAAAGSLDGTLGFTGGKVSGTLAITGGALPIAPVIGTLHDASAKVTIDDKTIHTELTGGLGGGTIELKADAPPELTSATAHLTLTKVALLGSRRTEISSEIGAKIKIAAGVVDGNLEVTNTRIKVMQRSGVALLAVSAPDDLVLPVGMPKKTVLAAAPPITKPADPEAPARAPSVHLHVSLDSTSLSAPDVVPIVPGVDVATVHAVAHSDDGLDITIGDAVSLSGRVDLDTGDVDFLGRRYLIDAGTSSVSFDGSVDPLLSIEMYYAFPSMTLTADVRGRASAPDPHLSSDVAGYSDDQLFAFFLGGSPGGDPSSETGEAVTSALAKVATGAIGRQFNRILPVKLDSVACAPGTTAASSACTFGKRFSRRLYLYYSTHPSPLPNENTNEFMLQYRLNNTTLLDVSGGDRNHAGADVLSRHPW